MLDYCFDMRWLSDRLERSFGQIPSPVSVSVWWVGHLNGAEIEWMGDKQTNKQMCPMTDTWTASVDPVLLLWMGIFKRAKRLQCHLLMRREVSWWARRHVHIAEHLQIGLPMGDGCPEPYEATIMTCYSVKFGGQSNRDKAHVEGSLPRRDKTRTNLDKDATNQNRKRKFN